MIFSMSKNLNMTGVGRKIGNFLINHLSYADDMVLIAPSAKALQVLLNVCDSFAKKNNVIYNTEKTKSMIFWPKVDVTDKARFMLHGKVLKVVHEIKYLGVYIVSNLTDDREMGIRVRAIYASGNTIISKFKKCNDECKVLMFKTYCYSVYGISLWCSYRVTSFAKVKIAHNDIFRSLLNVNRWESASSLFVSNHTNNLDVICRNSMYNLMERLLGSNNTIIEALCNSDVRIHSKIWKRWAVALGVEWESILMV